MENKVVSLILKAGMAILFLIGIVLIWNNISLAPSSDEDIALTDQAFFVVEHEQPDVDGKPQEPSKEVLYNYVVDAKANKVYDLAENKVLNYQAFVDSKGKTKTVEGDLKEGMVNDLVSKNYDFQNATTNSINFTKWLMIIAFIVILLFTVVNIIKNPKRFIRSAIGFAVLIIIGFICFKMAPEVGEGKMLETSNYTDKSFQYTGAGILVTGTLIFITVGLILYQGAINLFRLFSK